ncbi:Kae1-associated serine/threonine protein kinase [Candidatus Woesearchaeota archaeon]|nr:Kae1-associated serine/threonine protein kinase [Candidatus Woesearchaeota archaeon]
MKVIAQGAEAVIKVQENILYKERIPKTYRISEIDTKLRKQRTRSEAKLLQKVAGIAPQVFDVDETKMLITMEYLQGDVLKNVFDKLPENQRKKILRELGEKIARLHDQDIIHGDLTTTNVILCDGEVRLIDFGLGMISKKIEDRAVDLHLLKQALASKHYQHSDEAFAQIVEGYKQSKDHKAVLARLEKVEGRGRYKQKIQVF